MRPPIALFLAAWAAAALPAAAEHSVDFKVVVAMDHPATSMARDELARAFKLKIELWEDGTPVFPVDQTPESPVRRAFTREVLGMSVSSAQNYWQRMVFSGQGPPPPVAESDEEVLELVGRRKGAVGYVSAGTALGPSFRVLDVPDLGGYDAAAFARDGGGGEPEDVTVGRHGELRLFLTGSCGPDGEGRQAVLENADPNATLAAKIETAVWVDGWLRSSFSSVHAMPPLSEERLGCTRRSGNAEWRYALVEVSSAASYELSAHGHDGPARSAVDLVASGSCGAGRAGQWRALVNRHPYRQVQVAVEVREEVEGGTGRRYRKHLRLAPGSTQRLGCSADGRLVKRFAVLEVEYP